MPRVLVVGDVIDDVLVRPYGAIRPDTDTDASIERRAGGSAANVAAWLGTLGVDVDFVGTVGTTDVRHHAGMLEASGVRAHLVGSAAPTGTIVLVIDGQVRTMLTERGANVETVPATIPDGLLDAADHVHLTGYSLFRSDAAPWRSLVDTVGRRGGTISIDPSSASFLADYGVDRFLAVTAGADIVLPNLEEGRLLTGLADPRDVARSLAERYPVVALTLGPDGALVASAEGIVEVPADQPTPALVDPTGAGDAFAAAFLASWLEDRDLARAARRGVAIAARAVAAVGARPSP